MRQRKLLYILFIVFICAFGSFAKALPTNSEVEKRIEELLNQMTLEEKIGQLNQVSGVNEQYQILVREGKIGSLLNIRGATTANQLQKIAIEQSRLGIPLIFGNDVIHGYLTIFPIPLAEASTWNAELIQKASTVAAKEAAAAGTHWTFAPMVDIARDPRWGRIAECTGEDPYLGSVIARARVIGFQGNDLADPLTIVACPKHYIAYGAAEAGKDYNTVDISLRTLREVYLPPFKAAIESGAGTLMSAFNDLNGIPASANRFTLTQILREEWDFDGFVVSDWNSIGELINHGIATTLAEAGEKALKAGVDMDMMGFSYIRNLKQLVAQGKVTSIMIDEAVRRILRIKFRLGLFDNPYVDPQREDTTMLSKKNLEIALQDACESIVLLKNDKQILPLDRNIESLALIGPLTKDQDAPLGCWACEGKARDVVTIFEGIKTKIPAERIQYARGCNIEDNSTKDIAKAVKIAKKADVAIVAVGEAAWMCGEAACRATLDLPGVQRELVKAVYQTGTPTVVVLMNGRPLSIPWIDENIPAILETWFLGTQCGNAIADVLFGDYNPGGKLPVTFPRTVGQVPIYYNHKNTGRPPAKGKFTSKYLKMPVTPLYPFGYGLSYTKFEYSDFQISSNKIRTSENIVLSAVVNNTGKRKGDEVVQLYIQDVVASVTRPVKELKRFQRITLKPGEKKKVEFLLESKNLGFYNQEMNFVVEPGEFKVWIGPNSVEGLEGSFEITN